MVSNQRYQDIIKSLAEISILNKYDEDKIRLMFKPNVAEDIIKYITLL